MKYRTFVFLVLCAVLIISSCGENEPLSPGSKELTQSEQGAVLAKRSITEYTAIGDMQRVIEELNLEKGIENSLVSKVNNAQKSLEKGNDDAAINQLQAFINQIEAQRGKKISEETVDMLIAYANNVIAQIDDELNFDVNILFRNEIGVTIAASDGTTYIFGGMEFRDPNLIYAEEYWGEYPLYLPGRDALIDVNVMYNGPSEQADISIVTEVYKMNLDGSNGDPVKDPTTIYSTVTKDVTKIIDASFTLPIMPKGLNRFVVKLYHEGTLFTTKEGIFCPPGNLQ